MGESKKEEQEIGKRIEGMGRENSKTRWKMQRGRDWWNGSKKIDGRYWRRRRRRAMDHIGIKGETVIDYGIVKEESCFEEEKGRESTEKRRGGG
jgi:hypothetical protein